MGGASLFFSSSSVDAREAVSVSRFCWGPCPGAGKTRPRSDTKPHLEKLD